MQKLCKRCLIVKPVSEFKKHPETKDKLLGQCKCCCNEMQREYRIRNNNLMTKEYEKTYKGFLVRLYRNMKSRISGVQKRKYHLYIGKSILPKNDFYEWALNNKTFIELFDKYKLSGYNRKFAPSVDRLNSNIGYELNNMEFVTHSENSRRGSISKKSKVL